MCLHQNLGRRKRELEASRIVSSRNRLDENVSADLDVMLETAILWMTLVDDVNGLYLSGVRETCRTLRIRKIRVQVIIKLESFLLFQEL